MISVPQFSKNTQSNFDIVARCILIYLSYFWNAFFFILQIRANTSRNIRRLWNATMINVRSINCVNIFIAWIFYAWMSTKYCANVKKFYGIWNGTKNAMKVWPMDFCDFHPAMIVPFSLASANTMANKLIITVCKAIVTRFTSAPAMCKCIRTIIARIRLSCKKGECVF